MNPTIKQSLVTLLLLNSHLVATETLKDITVTSATKSTQNIGQVTSNIEVITAQEIEEKHLTTVAQALNLISGIGINSNGGLGQTTSVNLRGMSSKRILVLIDGIRYNDLTGLNGAPFSHLMASDIAQIEVLKGAQSGIWGADASAGVINIITKSAKEGFSFHASEEFGSFDTNKINAGVSYKTDKYYLKLNHNRVQTNGFSAQAPKGENIDHFEDDAYSNRTTNIKAGFTITPNNKIEITHTTIDARSDYDGYQDPNATNHSTTNNKFSSINFNHVDSFNKVNIYAKKSTFDREFVSNFGTSPFKGEVKEYGLSSKIPYLGDNFVVWGGDYKEFEQQGDVTKKYDNQAFFITNSNTFAGAIGGTTILTQSIRHDQYNKFDNKTTGKIGLKHIHSNIKGFSISANYGTAYNVPTLNNLFDPLSGNSKITPEETTSWDLTAHYKDMKITYFDTKVKDMIDYKSSYDAEGNWIGGNYDNVQGTSKIKGVEVGYKTHIGDDFLISSSYTYLDAKNSDKKRLSRQPKESVKMAIDYYGIEDLHLGIDGEYIGERYSLDDEQGQQTGKYTVANFNANYEVSSQMSVYGKVNNITDKQYQTIDGYTTSPRAIYGGMKLSY